MKKAKIAFIGSGGIAMSHLSNLKDYKDVELVGFCDVNEQTLEARVTEFGGTGFADAEEMVKAVQPDGVFICLPPFAHGPAEDACVKAGVPFFIEKPINIDLAGARRIAQKVKKAGLLTSVGYMNRYRAGISKARTLLKKDPPVLVQGGWIGGTPAGKGGIWEWWVQKDKSGGQFTEQVTHTVDLLRYTCGEAVEVSAYAAQGLNKGVPKGYSIEDSVAVVVKLARGGVATLCSCCAANAGGGGVFLDIYAPRHTMKFGGWDHSGTIATKGKDEPETVTGEANIFDIEDRAFVNAVKRGTSTGIRCDYADGVRSLEISIAADKSLRTGKPVKISAPE